jgi:hypothetical protein
MAPSHTARTAHTPAAPAAPGIVLALGPRPLGASPLLACGSFHLPLAEAEALGPEVHRALVLLVQLGAEHRVLMPFRDLLLFADDVVAVPDGVQGCFACDVFELLGGVLAGSYHVSVSLGARLSNVATTTVS